MHKSSKMHIKNLSRKGKLNNLLFLFLLAFIVITGCSHEPRSLIIETPEFCVSYDENNNNITYCEKETYKCEYINKKQYNRCLELIKEYQWGENEI